MPEFTKPYTIPVPGGSAEIEMTPPVWGQIDRRWHTSLWRGDERLHRDLWGVTLPLCYEIALDMSKTHAPLMGLDLKPILGNYATKDFVRQEIARNKASYSPMYGFMLIPFFLSIAAIILVVNTLGK